MESIMESFVVRSMICSFEFMTSHNLVTFDQTVMKVCLLFAYLLYIDFNYDTKNQNKRSLEMEAEQALNLTQNSRNRAQDSQNRLWIFGTFGVPLTILTILPISDFS